MSKWQKAKNVALVCMAAAAVGGWSLASTLDAEMDDMASSAQADLRAVTASYSDALDLQQAKVDDAATRVQEAQDREKKVASKLATANETIDDLNNDLGIRIQQVADLESAPAEVVEVATDDPALREALELSRAEVDHLLQALEHEMNGDTDAAQHELDKAHTLDEQVVEFVLR